MAYLKFNSVEVKNFHTIEEMYFPINPGKHLITGLNGSGKSSIFEALVWCLYKRSIRGNDPSTHGQGNLFVAVDFSVDGILHRVERSLKMTRGGSGVKLFCNGADISARIATEVDAQVESIIGISYELFISSCVVLQGLPLSFTQFTPSLRKSVFEGVVGFSIWDNYKSKVDKKSKELYNVLSEKQDKFAEKEKEMVSLHAKIETLESTNKGQSDLIKSKMKILKSEIASVEINITSLTSELSLIASPSSVFNELSAQKEKLYNLQSRSDSLESLVSGVCATCGQEYKEKDKAQKEFEEIKQSLLSVSSSVHSINLRYEATQKAHSQKNSDINSAKTQLKLLKTQFSQLSSEFASYSLSTDAEQLKNSLDKLNEEVNVLQSEIQTIEKEKSHFDWMSSTLQPSSKFRTEVLVDYINIVTKTIASISPVIFSNTKIGLRVNDKATGIEIDVEKDGCDIEYKQLSGGEKRRLDSIIILAIQKFLMDASGNKTNLVVLDELFENLDQEGIDSVVNTLDVIFPDSSAVHVITHNQDLKSRFDSIIQVQKTDGKSVVYV
jgi:DNA repair exonuclease SbcCD ATPase subunit